MARPAGMPIRHARRNPPSVTEKLAMKCSPSVAPSGRGSVSLVKNVSITCEGGESCCDEQIPTRTTSSQMRRKIKMPVRCLTQLGQRCFFAFFIAHHPASSCAARRKLVSKMPLSFRASHSSCEMLPWSTKNSMISLIYCQARLSPSSGSKNSSDSARV